MQSFTEKLNKPIFVVGAHLVRYAQKTYLQCYTLLKPHITRDQNMSLSRYTCNQWFQPNVFGQTIEKQSSNACCKNILLKSYDKMKVRCRYAMISIYGISTWSAHSFTPLRWVHGKLNIFQIYKHEPVTTTNFIVVYFHIKKCADASFFAKMSFGKNNDKLQKKLLVQNFSQSVRSILSRWPRQKDLFSIMPNVTLKAS